MRTNVELFCFRFPEYSHLPCVIDTIEYLLRRAVKSNMSYRFLQPATSVEYTKCGFSCDVHTSDILVSGFRYGLSIGERQGGAAASSDSPPATQTKLLIP